MKATALGAGTSTGTIWLKPLGDISVNESAEITGVRVPTLRTVPAVSDLLALRSAA